MKSIPHAILFVDDEQDVLNALQRAMRKAPYPCLYADSAKQAVELLSAQPVGVIVSDMRMPEMNGPQLLKYTRLHYPDIIPLVLSAWADSADILAAISSGHIYRYIIKPWNNDELRTVVRQAMELFELQWEQQVLLGQLEAQNELLEKKFASRTRQLIKIGNHAEIGKYASQIVHNLKNPLQVLFGALGLAQKLLPAAQHVHEERLTKYIEMAKRSAENLQQIIAGILMHVRDDNRQNPAAINLNEVIRFELEFFQIDPLFKENIDKKIDLDEKLPMVLGHSVQIRQIVDNLFRNAVDAMEESTRKNLTVRTRQRDGQVVLEVADTGHGIAENDMPHIFDSDFSTKPMDKGTGLGLASVQTMVASYAGDIQVSSKEGKGTTFIISFPIYAEHNDVESKNNL